jgi:hypothetical protein
MKKFPLFLITFALFFTLFTTRAFAADISISKPSAVNVGENFEVLININSDGKLINSADIILDYDQELVSFSGYKSEDTVINFWVDSPHEKNGSVYMSGIIPGGVLGLYDPKKPPQKGLGPIPIVRLLFTAKKEGKATFSFIKTQILEHDGAGTELAHYQVGGEVLIKNKTTESDLNEEGNVADKEKPDLFDITFLEASVFSRTPSMIIFNALDTGSGIKEYKMNMGGPRWTDAKSPQPVSKGIFSTNITIRAYDFAGNYQESSIRIPGILPPMTLLVIILALLTAACIAGYKMIKYKE